MADYVPKTTLEHLQELETALTKLRSGLQAYTTPDGTTYTKANYAWILKDYESTKAKYDEEVGNSPAPKTVSFASMSYE
jgi:hypothetical protein